MIVYEKKRIKTIISRTSYTRRVWKNNHMAFGRYPTEGCWNTVHCGKRSHYFAISLNELASITNISSEEARRVFENSDVQNAVINIKNRTVTIDINGKTHIFNRENSEQFHSFVLENGWMKEAAKSIPVNTSNKKNKKSNGDTRSIKTSSMCKISSIPSSKNIPYIKPNDVPVEFWSRRSEYEKAMLVNGLPIEKIDEFRNWDMRVYKFNKDKTISQRISMFKKKCIRLKQTEGCVSEIKYGLNPDDINKYRSWLAIEIKEKRAYKIKMKELIARFYMCNGLEPQKTSPVKVEFLSQKGIFQLHDAHVIEYRHRRKNRLKVLRGITQREGQARFRRGVLANFNACAITNIDCILEAAHIIPDATHDFMHPENGIALTSVLHKAFDELFFSINPETLTVFVTPSWRPFLNIHGITIPDGKIWPISRTALEHHWFRFKNNEAKGL